MTKSLSRRDVVRLGALGLAGGVGAAALAACGEGEVEVRTVEVEKIVTVTEIKEVEVEKVVEKEVVREVPVERVVTQEVQVEKIVEVEKVVEVPQETQVEGVFEIGPVKAVRFGNFRDLTPYNPQYGGKITHAAPGAINNLDPLHFPDAWSLMGGGQPLFDALIAHGPGGQLAPWLATDWSVSDDLLTYTFQLRNDVQFHDGTPFNAEAAKFNFELWMDPDMNPGWNANIGNQLASVTAPGDFTIELKLNEVNVFFLDLLAGGSAVFASPKAVAEYGEDLTRNPVSTGPYKFKEWKENISLTMVRNDDYNWGPPWALNQGPAFADEWTSFELTDVSAKVAAYEAEELSWMHHYSLTELQPFFGSPAHQVFIGLGPGQPWYLQTNTVNFPTDDLAVRKALIHATDRGTVTRSVTLGFGALAGSLLTPGTVGYNPDLDGYYDFNIEKANQILDEAGYARGDGGFRYSSDGQLLEVSFPDTPNPFSQPYKLNIENAIGISVATPNMEWGTAVEQYLQKMHTHKWQGGVGLEGGLVLDTVYHSRNFGVPGNRAYTWFVNEEIDSLLDAVRTEPDQAQRAQMTNRVHTILMEQALGIPLVEWGSLFPANTNKVGGRVFHTILTSPYPFDLYSTEG